MRVLFVHQNFPGQFKHLAPALVRKGHNVFAFTMRKDNNRNWQGVELFPYGVSQGSTPGIHPWILDFETKVIRADACFRAALKLKKDGFTPDVIIAHPGWGESLFLKDVWPKARLGIYCEFFYKLEGADVGFDPEFPEKDPEGQICRIYLKNLNYLLHMQKADAGIAPTFWQANTFPEEFREKITVVHDGINTDVCCPDSSATVAIKEKGGKEIHLSRSNKVLTFVSRNLEPYRGYHIFMRALPEILERCPDLHVLIVGGDGISYGAIPDPKRYGKKSWKEIFIEEVRPKITEKEWGRVLFLGVVHYAHFLKILQLSTVHVYLTYPFVLSWSLLEAMSVGCAIVASDTGPVREVMENGKTGLLVDFFDVKGLASTICALLDDPDKRMELGKNARQMIKEKYDLKTLCLPRQIEWVERLGN